MGPYSKYKGLNASSIDERIESFKIITLKMIAMGFSIEKIENLKPSFEDGEMYEAAQGITEALEDLKQNPPLSFFN